MFCPVPQKFDGGDWWCLVFNVSLSTTCLLLTIRITICISINRRISAYYIDRSIVNLLQGTKVIHRVVLLYFNP